MVGNWTREEEMPASILRLVRELMPLLLSGQSQDVQTLRAQYDQARISMEGTGKGYYVYFDVPEAAPLADPYWANGGPWSEAHIEGDTIVYGAGAILWLERGRLLALELYSCAEDWPEDEPITIVSVRAHD